VTTGERVNFTLKSCDVIYEPLVGKFRFVQQIKTLHRSFAAQIRTRSVLTFLVLGRSQLNSFQQQYPLLVELTTQSQMGTLSHNY